eukprot:6168736-Prymnesium_polylepis.1
MHDLELYSRILGHARDDCSDARAHRSISGRDFGSPSKLRARTTECLLPSIPVQSLGLDPMP